MNERLVMRFLRACKDSNNTLIPDWLGVLGDGRCPWLKAQRVPLCVWTCTTTKQKHREPAPRLDVATIDVDSIPDWCPDCALRESK